MNRLAVEGAAPTIWNSAIVKGGQTWAFARRPEPGTREEELYEKMGCKDDPQNKRFILVPRIVDAAVCAKGKVTHKEHATIILNCWHLVLPNTESQQAGFSDMAFLD